MKFAVVTSGVAPPIRSSQTTPPSTARNDARTNAISLNGYGLRPSTSTRGSFSRTARQTWPAEEPTASRTTTNTSTA